MATVSRLQGRFGNQLFQIAAAYAHSLRMNEPFIFHKWEYAQYFPNFKADPNPTGQGFIPYHEKDFTYKPIDKAHNLDLTGYFQSEKYFKDYEKEIRHLFWQEDTKSFMCAIHVRRGDYLQYSDIHINQSLEYYERAMGIMNKLGTSVGYIVFSDDIEWCKSQSIFKYCIFNEGKTPMDDFRSMRCCSSFIIANSSFSWWAAWLSSMPNKKVIAPSRWLARHYQNDIDVTPDEWILLK